MFLRNLYKFSKINSVLTNNKKNIIEKVRLCSTNFTEGLSVKDQNIQNYLKNITNEYYILKVAKDLDRSSRNRMSMLSPIVDLFEQRKCILDTLNSDEDMKKEKDEDMLELMKEENDMYSQILDKSDKELLEALLCIDEAPDFPALILEVTAGVGGQEAMLFAREIFDMYTNYIDYRRWDCDILQIENTDIHGIRHASAVVTGEDAFAFLQHEAGVHRVQRIPVTEKSARVHTSTVTVAVIPRPEDFNLNIRDKDLRIETKRASGAGGQHVNTTDSAVRMTHVPSGIMVDAQSERSQIKNRELCMKKLEAKLYKAEMDSQMASKQATRKSQVGSSNRNEKIRTYNFHQDRVTDHRIEQGTTHNLKGFFEGGASLDSMIVKLIKSSRREQLLEIINNIPKEKIEKS